MNIHIEPISEKEDISKPEYASENCQQLLKSWQAYFPKIGYHPPWVGYFVKIETTVAGTIAFVSPPVENRAEISYWVFPEFQNKGVATEACRQIVLIAKEKLPGIIVTAKTEPRVTASSKVLERNGFIYSGIVQDHEIGDAWEWVFQ